MDVGTGVGVSVEEFPVQGGMLSRDLSFVRVLGVLVGGVILLFSIYIC